MPIMNASGSRFTTVAVYALIVLAAVALPIEASEPIHLHHGDGPAFYNGECPLATLAAFHGLAPLPVRPASVSATLVLAAPPLHATASVVTPLVGHTDPRAPPLL